MHAPVTEEIIKFLSRPFDITPGIAFFLKSTLAIDTPTETSAFLMSEEAAESGIYRLLFHPSRGLRESLERHLPPKGLSLHDIEKIKDKIRGEVKTLAVRLDGKSLPGALTLTGTLLEEIITPLNIGLPLPDAIPAKRGSDPSLPVPAHLRAALRKNWHRISPRGREEMLLLTGALARNSRQKKKYDSTA